MSTMSKVTVQYEHIRIHARRHNKMDADIYLAEKGGTTIASIFNEDRELLAVGYAVCHPKDNYNKKVGRDIARGRAFKALQEQRVQPLISRTSDIRTGHAWPLPLDNGSQLW